MPSCFGERRGKSDVADAADARRHGGRARRCSQQKADVNAPQADGATALHWAVYRGDTELADLLIDAGANAKAANREGATPLWLASVNGDAADDRARCSTPAPIRTRRCRSDARR